MRTLARELEVNTHTVVRAYKDLEGEELVSIRQGRGVVIRKGSQTRARRLRGLVTDTIQDASKHGLSLRQLLILLEGAS